MEQQQIMLQRPALLLRQWATNTKTFVDWSETIFVILTFSFTSFTFSFSNITVDADSADSSWTLLLLSFSQYGPLNHCAVPPPSPPTRMGRWTTVPNGCVYVRNLDAATYPTHTDRSRRRLQLLKQSKEPIFRCVGYTLFYWALWMYQCKSVNFAHVYNTFDTLKWKRATKL